MNYSLKLKKFIAGFLTVVMIAAYMPMVTFAKPDETAQAVPEKDWNFDAATGTLKGFNGGTSYDNPVDIVIPDTIKGVEVKSLGKEAFRWSDSSYGKKIKNQLKSVKLPSTLENTGTWAFQGNDIKKIVIPKGVKVLGERTFFGNKNLTDVTFEEGNRLSEVGPSAFYTCYSLADIKLPSSVKKIGDSAFKETGFKKIELHEGITEINDQAFALDTFAEITLPSTVEIIGKPNGKPNTGVFFRNFESITRNQYGTASGQLIFTKIFDKSGKATVENTKGVVNPQPVTIKYQTESGKELKAPETFTGAQYNDFVDKKVVPGDGHYYTDYKNNYTTASVYDSAEKMIGENYFAVGREYTFKAPEVAGYAAVNGEVKKTVTKEEHEVTFTYKEREKVKLTTKGEGLTVEPNKKELPEGSEVTAVIHEPSNKKIKRVTLNKKDITKEFKFDGVDHIYKFKIESDTEIEVSYKEAKNNVELELDKKDIDLGGKVKADIIYRGEKIESTENTVDYTFADNKKVDVDHENGTIKPLEAGKIKVTVSLKRHPEIKAKKVITVHPVNVTIRMEDVNKTVLPKTPVEISKLYLEKDKNYYTDITVKDPDPFMAMETVLRKYLKVNTAKKDEFDCGDSGNWMRILGKDLWKNINKDGSHMFYVNGELANAGVGERALKDGDDVCIFYEEDWKNPSYLGMFEQEDYKIKEGETVSLKVLGRQYVMGNSGSVTKEAVPIKNATLMINNDPATLTGEVFSGEDGVIDRRFDTPGTYFVSAVGAGDIKITRPYAKVVVMPSKSEPEAPKRIKTVNKYKQKTIEVHYSKVKDAEKYDIAYKNVKDKVWKHKYTANASMYKLKGLKAGNLYAVKVAAMSKVHDKMIAGKYSKVSYSYFAAVKKIKCKAKKSGIEVSFSKVKGAGGYELLVYTNKNLKGGKVVVLKGAAKTKKFIKKIKGKKTYFVALRPYKTYKGVKYAGVRTGIKKVNLKK